MSSNEKSIGAGISDAVATLSFYGFIAFCLWLLFTAFVFPTHGDPFGM